MAGLPPRPPTNPYVDERRRPPPPLNKERDRSRDQNGPVRRDSREVRDDGTDLARRSSVTVAGTPTSPRGGRHSSSRVLDPDLRPANRAPSRLVKRVDMLELKCRPPTISNTEHQEISDAFWTWGTALLERGSVKTQLDRCHSESGMRTANNAKLEKADEGTSLALLKRTQQRQYEKDTKVLSAKITEIDKGEHKALQSLIAKLVATSKQPAPSLGDAVKDDSATKALERKFEMMQSHFDKQEEKLAAHSRAFSEQEERNEKWQMQIQQLELQHLASIKSIDVLRAENDSLRKQLTAQLQEVSKNSKKTPDTVQSELERIKNDLRRIEVESKGRYDSAQATGNQISENISRLLQQTLAKVETLTSAHGQCKSVQDELAGRIKEIDNNCTTLTETLKTCKAEVIDTTQKIDSLDLESLDQMVNTWLDRKIPSRVKDHDLSINSIRQELSAIKDYVSKKTLAPGAILPYSVTEEFVASKIASLRKDVDETVKDANDCIADMIDETTRDVQSLKDGKLPERIAALEAAHRSNATSQTPDLAVASRVRVLEDQKLLEKIHSLQAICMQRLQGLDEATRTMASRPHEPTSQVLHRDIQAVKNQLDGVAMQANNLDTQFKNVSTKDMARLILGELNQVNSKADTLGRQAIDTTEKLSSRFESLQSELARSQRGQDSLQARIEEVSNLVDLVVRSGARTGDKRPSEGSPNGINDPKRQRTGSKTSAQVRASPSSMPAVTNGAPRQSH